MIDAEKQVDALPILCHPLWRVCRYVELRFGSSMRNLDDG
jgi:hypothetical protein